MQNNLMVFGWLSRQYTQPRMYQLLIRSHSLLTQQKANWTKQTTVQQYLNYSIWCSHP